MADRKTSLCSRNDARIFSFEGPANDSLFWLECYSNVPPVGARRISFLKETMSVRSEPTYNERKNTLDCYGKQDRCTVSRTKEGNKKFGKEMRLTRKKNIRLDSQDQVERSAEDTKIMKMLEKVRGKYLNTF